MLAAAERTTDRRAKRHPSVRSQQKLALGEHTNLRSKEVSLKPIPAFLTAWALAGLGTVSGSIVGNAAGKLGLFAGAVVGGVVGVWAAVAALTNLGVLRTMFSHRLRLKLRGVAAAW